ncbi:MAG: hypothetical protein KIT33_12910 [Candidatus Kapabacteria bacterium]|nr:hypothetical protein [Candidatus Kapabacteria bacterium]
MAQDYFQVFDCTKIFGNIDFCGGVGYLFAINSSQLRSFHQLTIDNFMKDKKKLPKFSKLRKFNNNIALLIIVSDYKHIKRK